MWRTGELFEFSTLDWGRLEWVEKITEKTNRERQSNASGEYGAEVWSIAIACADPVKRSLCVSQLHPSGTAVSYGWLTCAACLLQLSS